MKEKAGFKAAKIKNPYFYDFSEEILMNLPESNCFGNEKHLPLGWFLNYKDHFCEFHTDKLEMKHLKYKKSVQKIWEKEGEKISKLQKAYEIFDKPIEEMVKTDNQEKVLGIMNFINRMKGYLKSIKNIMQHLNIFSVSPMLECLSEEKALELANLI